MVDSLVHPNWFQASGSCFAEQSAEISAQPSVSMTAKHSFSGEGNAWADLNREPFGLWRLEEKQRVCLLAVVFSSSLKGKEMSAGQQGVLGQRGPTSSVWLEEREMCLSLQSA